MAYTDGVFSPSTNAAILIKETDFIVENRIQETNKPIVAGQAILDQQNPILTLLGEQKGDGMKCTSAKLVALRTCDNTVEDDLTLDCEVPAGNEGGTEALVLGKQIISIARFSVWDSQCNNVFSFDDLVAQNKAIAKVNIEVDLSRKLVAYAAANADTPSTDWFETPGTVSGNKFVIANEDWNEDIYGDILYAANLTDIYNPMMLNGRNFYKDTFLSQYKGLACCDNQGVLRGAPWPINFDIRNIDQTLGGNYTLVLDKNSLLFWSSVEWTNVAPRLTVADTYVWSEPLPRLKYMANGAQQTIMVDIRARKDCRNGKDYGVHYEIILTGEMKANLPNCDGRKGILKIEKAAPTP